jgi:CubicO group peptidase (beta-lactamase class C family)
MNEAVAGGARMARLGLGWLQPPFPLNGYSTGLAWWSNLPPHPLFVCPIPFGGGHGVQHIPGGYGALRVISAHIRAERAVQTLIVVFAHRMPVTGIWRGGAAVGQRVADLPRLVVGHLPDVLAFGVG